MQLHLKIIGALLMLLALIHIFFPAYFKWKQQFAALSLINKQMVYVHTFFIALIVFMMGLLCFTSAGELCNTALGKKISMGLAFFWALRLLIQFFGYSRKLWRGKRFETCIHIVFSGLWIYCCWVFFRIAFGS
jgi:hypothetical protein